MNVIDNQDYKQQIDTGSNIMIQIMMIIRMSSICIIMIMTRLSNGKFNYEEIGANLCGLRYKLSQFSNQSMGS